MSHSQFLQMRNTCLLTQISMGAVFRQSQKFSSMLDACNRIDRKITMMHLVNNDIRKTF